MKSNLYKRLISFLLPYKGKVVFTIFTSVIVGAISTSPVPLVQKTFDDIFVNKDAFMLKMLPLVIIALYLVKGSLRYIQSRIIYQIGWELVAQLRLDLFRHIHKLPYEFYEIDTTGQLMSRVVNDVNAMLLSITKQVKDTLQNFVMLVGLLGWIFYLNASFSTIFLSIKTRSC